MSIQRNRSSIAGSCLWYSTLRQGQGYDFDDISEEGSYELANMKATSNAETEFAMGVNRRRCLLQLPQHIQEWVSSITWSLFTVLIRRLVF